MRIVIAWAIAVAAGLVLLTACGGGGEDATPTPNASTPTPTSTLQSADVDAVDCSPLLTQAEVDDALGWSTSDDRPGPIENARGEVCLHSLLRDNDVFLQIQPGQPGDFEPGASVIGVSGEPVAGVGDEALWFGGEDSEAGGDVGALSVRQDTELGALYFRIFLGRPDLDSDEQREVAKTVALAALPRFPGVEEELPEPELLTFEPEPFDRSVLSYGENLLVKEEAGEWTRGEGLVATLRYFVGEIDATQVLRHPEVIEYPGTGVVRLAREYLETGTEAEARTEIARLLALFVPSIERLEQEGAIGSSELNTAPFRFVSLGPVFQKQDPEQDQWCNQAYGIDSPCVLEVDLPLIDAMWSGYSLYRPVAEVAGGWTIVQIDWAREAMFKSAVVLEPLGKMPQVTVLLGPYPESAADVVSGGCVLEIGKNSQGKEGEFKQKLALLLAQCLVHGTFSGIPWWGTGLALYLSGVVYDDVNWEHNFSSFLESEELTNTLTDRSYTNWALFEFMHASLGAEGIFNLVEGLPSSAGAFFHDFARSLTDADLPDIGPGVVPYEPKAFPLQIGGAVELTVAPIVFGVRRIHAVVASGQFACFETFASGEFQGSWRKGRPGGSGEWGGLPSLLSGESVFLVTTTKPGASLDLVVTKLVEDPEECEEPTPTPIEEGAGGGGGSGSGDGSGSGGNPCELECEKSEFYWPLRTG